VPSLARRLVVALLVAALVGATTACGSSREGSEPSTPTATTYASDNGSAYSGGDYASDDDYYPYADAQEAWDNEDGPDWEAFNDAYATGWDEGCDTAFSGSPDGYLYDQGEQFSAEDCYFNNPGDASSSAEVPIEAPVDPGVEGEEFGNHDGCVSAFDELGYDGALFYGDVGYGSSDCP
jgi:hypothetical protein